MMTAKKDADARRERFTARLPIDMLQAIDASRSQRVGTISRNTWITEAIQEKLQRGSQSTATKGGS